MLESDLNWILEVLPVFDIKFKIDIQFDGKRNSITVLLSEKKRTVREKFLIKLYYFSRITTSFIRFIFEHKTGIYSEMRSLFWSQKLFIKIHFFHWISFNNLISIWKKKIENQFNCIIAENDLNIIITDVI